jgi:hypothetical protein
MTPTPDSDGEDTPSSPNPLHTAASWASAVIGSLAADPPPSLPGIVNPLQFTADFAENSQDDAVSVTMANAVVKLAGVPGPSSGALTLSLRWSDGFRADGIALGDSLPGDWRVVSLESTRIDLAHAPLTHDAHGALVPTVTIVKPNAARADDEFVARLVGTLGACRSQVVRGWAHG